MNKENGKRTLMISFIREMPGCLCHGSGDWLMIYGAPAHSGSDIPLAEQLGDAPGVPGDDFLRNRASQRR